MQVPAAARCSASSVAPERRTRNDGSSTTGQPPHAGRLRTPRGRHRPNGRTPAEPELDGGSGMWVDVVGPLQRFSHHIMGCSRCRAGAPASTRSLSAPPDLLSGPSWSPGRALHSSSSRMASWRATPTALRVWAGHGHVRPADLSALNLLGLLITALSSRSSSSPSSGDLRGDGGPRGTSRRAAPGVCGRPAT